jgi:hypothetical protein
MGNLQALQSASNHGACRLGPGVRGSSRTNHTNPGMTCSREYAVALARARARARARATWRLPLDGSGYLDITPRSIFYITSCGNGWPFCQVHCSQGPRSAPHSTVALHCHYGKTGCDSCIVCPGFRGASASSYVGGGAGRAGDDSTMTMSPASPPLS